MELTHTQDVVDTWGHGTDIYTRYRGYLRLWNWHIHKISWIPEAMELTYTTRYRGYLRLWNWHIHKISWITEAMELTYTQDIVDTWGHGTDIYTRYRGYFRPGKWLIHRILWIPEAWYIQYTLGLVDTLAGNNYYTHRPLQIPSARKQVNCIYTTPRGYLDLWTSHVHIYNLSNFSSLTTSGK